MPDDRELTRHPGVGPAAGRSGSRDWPPSTSWWCPARARRSSSDDILVASAARAAVLVRARLGRRWWSSLALIANLLPLPNPDFQNYSAINASPSLHHLLGTDELGRDLLSRLIFGARVSLVVGFGSVGIGMVVGGTLGLVSGYKGGAAGRRPQRRLLRAPGLPGHRGRDRHRGLLGPVAAQDHHHHRGGEHPGALPGGAGLEPVLRQPRLRHRGQDPGGQVAPGWSSGRSCPTSCPAAVSFGLIAVAAVIVLEGSLAFLGPVGAAAHPVLGQHDRRGIVQRQPADQPATS